MTPTRSSTTVDVLAALEACGAYVEDAASFPEQFKPGVVKLHQRQYAQASTAIVSLLEAADRLQAVLPQGMALQPYFAGKELAALRKAVAAARGDSCLTEATNRVQSGHAPPNRECTRSHRDCQEFVCRGTT